MVCCAIEADAGTAGVFSAYAVCSELPVQIRWSFNATILVPQRWTAAKIGHACL